MAVRDAARARKLRKLAGISGLERVGDGKPPELVSAGKRGSWWVVTVRRCGCWVMVYGERWVWELVVFLWVLALVLVGNRGEMRRLLSSCRKRLSSGVVTG